MSQQWYYTRGGGSQIGPVETDALRQLIAVGNVTADDLVWSEGMADWRRAADVHAFFAPAAAAVASPRTMPYNQPYAQPYGAAAPSMLNYQSPFAMPAYAGFWLRLCAAFVDGIIIFVINFAIGFVFGLAIVSSGSRIDPGTKFLLQMLGLLIGWLYSALQESSTAQATVGKRAVGIYVTDARGQRISFGRATGRHFAKIISAIILLIGYIMAAFTERKQALHDMMADTLVMKK